MAVLSSTVGAVRECNYYPVRFYRVETGRAQASDHALAAVHLALGPRRLLHIALSQGRPSAPA